MRNINLRYVEETYDNSGVLTSFRLKYPENFNFGYDVVDDIGLNEPDRRAMVWCNPKGEKRIFTFGDIMRYSNKTANYLSSLGIKKGDMVLVVLKRHYQFWYVAPALHKLGAVMIPATHMLKKHDVEYRVNASGAKAVICTAQGDVADAFDQAQPDCPTLDLKILVGGEREGWLSFDQGVEEAGETWERIETHVSDPLLMYFSSGTTGYPKMVLHDHRYSLAHLFTAKHWQNVDPEGIHLTIADTGWGKAVWGKLYGQWIMEACVFTYDFDTFVPSEILSLIGEYKITSLCCPPTMFRYFLKEDLDKFDLSSLKYSTIAGEPLNPDVFYGWHEKTGIWLMEGFGQTETTVTVCNIVGTTPRAGSIGKPSLLYDVDLINEKGNSCKPGETGEIVIKYDPRPAGMMVCYYKDEEKTNQAFSGGYYHTGDTAWRDEDGYYYYVGRNDDIIKSSGYRIGPFEVESVLVTHPAVLECAVTSAPDEIRGAVVKASVVLSNGYEPSEELKKELQEYVKKETAPYKYPRIIEFLDQLPKTINGKVRRSELRGGK
ncbi:MAG: AMP-binding protein [Clostridiales bacterium]|jgi:acetyl-CoA synthetase|nr:AMP-binding protein [Clostridiales bacterium]